MSKHVSPPLRVIITGSTGMVGKGVLFECMEHPMVEKILLINRHPVGIEHPRIREIIHKDFSDLSSIQNELTGYNACYFCSGVSAFRMSETEYMRLTYDITLYVAKKVLQANPGILFCYVSGQGTDSTGTGRIMWARIKGRTENELASMKFNGAYMFRPGYIQPAPGIRSRTRVYNMVYAVFGPLYPLIKKLAPNSVTTNTALGKAMIQVALDGYEKQILNPPDINRLGGE